MSAGPTPDELFDARMFESVVGRFSAALASYLQSTGERRVPLSDGATPEELFAEVNEPMPRSGRGVDATVERVLSFYLGNANRLAHPRYIGHQVAPPLPLAAATDLIGSVLNNGAAIWEMSPAGTVLEHLVCAWFAREIGWAWPLEPGLDGAGGSFVDGGTLGNLSALAAARARAFPDAWEHGYEPLETAIICADTAHYCMERTAGIFGMGKRGLYLGKTTNGRLTPDAARAAIERARADGREPFVLVGCSGSTAVGAFDDLPALAEVAREAGLWFHVDAAHGGAFLLSERLRAGMQGIELADSVTIDLHKMMFQPISTAMVLVRDAATLRAAFSQDQSYVFHPRSDGPNWDQGPHTFQCSRRLDVLRAWTSLQAYGADGIARLQELCVDLATATAREIDTNPALEIALEPQSNILCFRHRPNRADGEPLTGPALDQHNADLRERVNRDRETYITATTFEGARWLRFTFINPRTTPDDVLAVLARICALGDENVPAQA